MFRHTARQPRPDSATEPSEPPASAPVAAVDDANFLDWTAGGISVVDFWAPWCGPCHAFAPIFEGAARDYEGTVAFGKCNVDESPRTAGLLQIRSIPTLVVFGPEGDELDRVVGVVPRRHLDEILARHLPGAA